METAGVVFFEATLEILVNFARIAAIRMGAWIAWMGM